MPYEISSLKPDPRVAAVSVHSVEVTIAAKEVFLALKDGNGALDVFRLSIATAEDLARKIGSILEFPWTNHKAVPQLCPRHPTFRVACGATCLDCLSGMVRSLT